LAIELTLSVSSRHTPVTSAHLGLAAELALGADLARHAGHLGGEDRELLDHGVDDGGGAQELALQWPAVDVEPHRLQQVALSHGGDHPRDLGGRPDEVVDQRIDRTLHLAPGAGGQAELHALAGAALLADRLADALELPGHALVAGGDVVHHRGDPTQGAVMIARQANGEIAAAQGLEHAQ
jgi:hypothetical protein